MTSSTGLPDDFGVLTRTAALFLVRVVECTFGLAGLTEGNLKTYVSIEEQEGEGEGKSGE